LRLGNATALSGGIAATGGTSALTINGGVVELTTAGGNFLRNLGTGVDQVQITGGISGFSAANALSVNFNYDAHQITWGDAAFAPTVLVLNDTTAAAGLTFANAIALGAAERTVAVNANSATISGAISGAGSLSKTGTGNLVLSVANAFTGGLHIKQGTVSLGNLAAAGDITGGGGTIYLGNSTGSADATLAITINGSGMTANPISVVAGNTGTATINFAHTATTGYVTGLITLDNHDLFLGNTTAGLYGRVEGGITGTGNLIFKASGAGDTLINVAAGNIDTIGNITFNNSNTTATQLYTTGAINNTGTIANISTSTGLISITAPIGAKVTGVTQNSNTSTMILAGLNTYTGPTTILQGTLQLGSGTTGRLNSLSAITNDGTLIISQTSTITQGTDFASVISGSGQVYVTGKSGFIVLNGLNTFTGPVTVAGGTGNLVFNTIKNVGSGSSALGAPTTQANGIITLGNGNSSGNLIYTGTGDTTDRIINLFGYNTTDTIYADNTSGQLTFTSDLQSTGGNGQTKALRLYGTGTGEFFGAIGDSTSGTATPTSLTKDGTGVWTLSGNNTYTGGTTLSVGTLILGNDNALGTGAFQWSANASGGNNSILQASTAVTISNNMTLHGNGNIGTFSGSNSATFTGNVINNASATGDTPVTIRMMADSGAVLTLASNVYLAGLDAAKTFGLTGTGAIVVSGNIADWSGGRFTVAGGGLNLGLLSNGSTIATDNGTITLSGQNSYTGLTTLKNATVILANDYALGGYGTSRGTFNWAGGTLQAGAGGVTIGNTVSFTSTTGGKFTGANSATFTGEWTDNSSRTLTVNNTGGLLTLAGNVFISDNNTTTTRILTLDGSGTLLVSGGIANNNFGNTQAGSLTKSGSGLVTLSGINTYTGPTKVTDGRLVVDGSVAAGSAVYVTGGTLGGTGTAYGTVTIGVDGTLAPGNSVGTFTTGDFTLAGTLAVELGRDGVTPVNDVVVANGTVTLQTGANLQLSIGAGLSNPVAGDTFYLIDNLSLDPVSGEFTKVNGLDTALGEGSTFDWNTQTWKITYLANFGTSFTGGHDIALVVVPEPSTSAMVAFGILGMLMLRRLRRK
jgi:autotransporter-associated beta strand protein